MGYIFDALNKKRDGQNKPAAEPDAEEPGVDAVADASPSPAAPDDTEGAPEANTEPKDKPLRLSEIQDQLEKDQREVEKAEDPISAIVAALKIPDDSFDDEPNPFMSREVDITPFGPNIRVEPAPKENDPYDPEIDIYDNTPLLITNEEPPPVKGWWNKLLGRHLRGKVDDRLVAMTSPASAMSEEYRSIRTSILAQHSQERHMVQTITSATPQEGKTITCVNLGLSFAELRNRSTIIIECDLRLPTFAKLLNCREDQPGLIDYLRGNAPLKDVVQKIEGSELHIIPAGDRVSDEAVQLLSSSRMSRLIQALRSKYDHVIIDTPPVLQLADAGILGSQSDEVLLVARMRRTPRPLVEQAVKTLGSYNAVVSGVIATDNPRSRGRGYGYKYGYGYRYGYGYTYGYTDNRRKSAKKSKSRRAA